MTFLQIQPHIQVIFWIFVVIASLFVVAFVGWIIYKIKERNAESLLKTAQEEEPRAEDYRKLGETDYSAYNAAQSEHYDKYQPLRTASSRAYDRAEFFTAVWGILLIPTAIFGVILALVLIPYSPKYWSWYQLEGKIAAIDNVFEAEDSELVNNAVVTLEGFDTPFVVSDPRILTLDEGATVTFRCDWEWVNGGEDRLGCLIADYGTK